MDDLEDCLNQVYRMALAGYQSYTYWHYTNPEDSPFEGVLKKYGAFFYAANEAHLNMMFISLDCLYVEKDKFMTFTRLLALAKDKIDKGNLDRLEGKIQKLAKLAEGVGIIRNNSFAHVTLWKTRMEQGAKWNLSNGDYLALCYHSYEVASRISTLLGRVVLSADEVGEETLNSVQAMFNKLGEGEVIAVTSTPEPTL